MHQLGGTVTMLKKLSLPSASKMQVQLSHNKQNLKILK